jgi:hypothetical protein
MFMLFFPRGVKITIKDPKQIMPITAYMFLQEAYLWYYALV